MSLRTCRSWLVISAEWRTTRNPGHAAPGESSAAAIGRSQPRHPRVSLS